jgi:hypothetical protein
MKASTAPFACDFFVAAIELNGFIKPIGQMPYGRPFRTQTSAKSEAKRFLASLTPREHSMVERAVAEEAAA